MRVPRIRQQTRNEANIYLLRYYTEYLSLRIRTADSSNVRNKEKKGEKKRNFYIGPKYKGKVELEAKQIRGSPTIYLGERGSSFRMSRRGGAIGACEQQFSTDRLLVSELHCRHRQQHSRTQNAPALGQLLRDHNELQTFQIRHMQVKMYDNFRISIDYEW